MLGAGSTGLVGDSVRGDERLASISSAIVNDVYSRRCLCEGVEPGCLQTRENQTFLINRALHLFQVSQSKCTFSIRYKSLYISLASSAQQQCEMTKL